MTRSDAGSLKAWGWGNDKEIPCRMKVLAASPLVLGDARISPDGTWVAAWDVNAKDGLGTVRFTEDPESAAIFPNATAAMSAYRSQSTAKPYRDDGRPNRPLLALTIEIEHLTETEEST